MNLCAIQVTPYRSCLRLPFLLNPLGDQRNLNHKPMVHGWCHICFIWIMWTHWTMETPANPRMVGRPNKKHFNQAYQNQWKMWYHWSCKSSPSIAHVLLCYFHFSKTDTQNWLRTVPIDTPPRLEQFELVCVSQSCKHTQYVESEIASKHGKISMLRKTLCSNNVSGNTGNLQVNKMVHYVLKRRLHNQQFL